MFIVHVHVHVKAESVEAFKAVMMQNARSSLFEPGVARFDIIQEQENPTRFVLVEVYRSEADVAAHKETAHYQTRRDAVAAMMAEPRTSFKYTNIFPDDRGWD